MIARFQSTYSGCTVIDPLERMEVCSLISFFTVVYVLSHGLRLCVYCKEAFTPVDAYVTDKGFPLRQYTHLLMYAGLLRLEFAGVSHGADTRANKGDEEEENSKATAVYVKYNRLLHGERKGRHGKKDVLTIKFLKKYINYAKSRMQPVLTEEVCPHILFKSYFYLRCIQILQISPRHLIEVNLEVAWASCIPPMIKSKCLTQASEQIAQAYAEMRNNGADNKVTTYNQRV